jgi:hypothetical protein
VLLSILLAILLIGCYLISNNTSRSIISKDWLGISLHELSEDEAKTVKDSTATWIRIDASQNHLETALDNAKEHDLKVLTILDSWMFNKTIEFTLDEWMGNVTFYVSKYASQVDAWEIWNEPAHPNFTIPAEKYFSMVQIASSIIRQYDPSAKILLFGGLHLWSGVDSQLELDMELANQLAAQNIEEYGDAISIHAYPWMGQVEVWVWEKYDDSLEYYQELFPSLEVWVTETGQSIDDFGESGQAKYIHDALQYFNKKVAKLFCYCLVDNPWENKFGIINENGAPRSAYYELKKSLNFED